MWGYPDFVGDTPAFTSLSTPDSSYVKETFYLAAFAQDTVLIRFQFASDASITQPGWYVDDVAVEESPEADVAPTDIVEPAILTSMGPLEVMAEIVNFGSAIQTFDVKLEVDTSGGSGGNEFTDVKSVGNLAATDTTLVTFSVWTPGQAGHYDFRVITQLLGDADPLNDTLFAQIFILGIVNLPYSEDLEDSAGGFFATGSWEWGEPTSGPGSAYSGAMLWATDLDTNYSNHAQDFVYLPAVDLTGLAEVPFLSFYHHYDMEEDYDGGVVQVSTDGGWTFATLAPIGGYPGAINLGEDSAYTGLSTPDSSYAKAAFNLNSYVGDTVIFRLQFVSDRYATFPGWYVDDINLTTILPYPCGDCNGDGWIGPGDIVYLINYLFRDEPPPEPTCIGDVNCDGVASAGDVVYLIGYLFRSGPPPCPECCFLKAGTEKPTGQKIEKDSGKIRKVPQKPPQAPGDLKQTR